MEKGNIKWQYERQETTQDPKTTTKNGMGLNPNPCGSYPLQPSSDLHNPLKLEPNQTCKPTC
jgi:hypothetical protein